MKTLATIAAAAALMTVGHASAGYTITQGASAPTYGTTLNFDEPGGPTGAVSTDAWLSLGITELQAGDGAPQVDNFDPTFGGSGGWLGGGTNSFYGNFGVFISFDSDITEFSAQVWDPSGPPSLLGGGMIVELYDDGNYVGGLSFGSEATPAWGGLGDSWFDITTDSGSAFDEVRFVGLGFGPTTFVDDLSWNAVPAPGALALLGLAGVCGRGRRRD
jgi:MYXO-CTERM domain-containing protein